MKICFLRLPVFALLLSLFAQPLHVSAQNPPDWNVAVLDGILAGVQPGQTLVRIGDMEVLVSNVQAWRNQLAGVPGPQSAFGATAPLWTSGNVYYAFTNTLSAAKQKAFLDAAAEWATFANLNFIQRTVQANYIHVVENPSLGSGGVSALGMVGGAQLFQVGPSAWVRGLLCHELGHALGMVHEQQRSDRDSFVTIMTNNIQPGASNDYVKLGNSQNQGAYDFLSIMHYARNTFSTNPAVDTIVPLPAYTQFTDIMGRQNDPVLSALDRAGMALKYGAGPVIGSVVTNTKDGGLGSLRTALYYAFDNPGTTITFNIATNDPGFSNNVFTIQPSDQMTGLFNSTVINGASEPVQMNPNGPAIVLNGAAAALLNPGASGLRFRGTNSTTRAMVINGFPNHAVHFEGTNCVSNTVSGSYLGVNTSGTASVPNGFYPVYLAGGANGNVIGGTNAADRNIISGGSFQGIFVTGTTTMNNKIMGNYIGLNAAGTAAIPNGAAGVGLFNAAKSNTVGGTVAGAGNVISGNINQGVSISGSGTDGNVVAGNTIGLNAAGTAAIANTFSGVVISSGAQGNVVGGGNVISGNANQGVLILNSGTKNNVIQGNYIGLNAAGTAAIGNAFGGIAIGSGAQSNRVGGVYASMRNVISGNDSQGITISDSGTDGNRIEGNYIGLNAAGLLAVPNDFPGIQIFGGAKNNIVGGGVGRRNFISGNNSQGATVSEAGTTGNVVTGNTIGLNVTNGAVPNNGIGVAAYDGATNNQIGGTVPGEANVIAFNTSVGVAIINPTTSNISVRGNSLYGNTSGGLSLSDGGNHLQTAPSLSSAAVGTNTTIIGSLTSASNTLFHLDFYASAPVSPQATAYIGSKDVTTSGAGAVTFTNVAGIVPTGQIIRATATDPAGNTSGLSANVTVTTTDSVGDGIPNAWRAANFGGTGMATNNTNCATCDADGDGMTTRQEFLAGTHPTNSASVLKVGAVAISGTNVTIDFQSVAGMTYRIESRPEASPAPWSLMGSQMLSPGGVMQAMDPGAASLLRRFYRVGIEH